MAAMASRRDGLTAEEAAERLRRHGPNRLPPPKARSAAARFLAQFDNLLIAVLLVAGAITLGLRHWVDSGVIFGVVLINALIGQLQEGKAEKALEAIRRMLSPQATVLRDRRRQAIDAEGVVPGDVVLLEPGDRVPADVRLLETRNLQVQEALLTGESLPVEKGEAPVDPAAPLGDRCSMAYAGTLVTRGSGWGVVVATALESELGGISSMLRSVEKLETPLLKQIRQFSRWLTAAILALAAATFLVGVLVHHFALPDMFLGAVGLAVAAIPEGLPAVITITLAIGVQRMARRSAIVRRLPAVETLGSVTVICSDKTGTLTRNEMTVRRVALRGGVVEVQGVGYGPEGTLRREGRELPPEALPELVEAARGGALCSDSELQLRDGEWSVSGDPMEGALLALAAKSGLDLPALASQMPRLDAIPFDPERRLMATAHPGPAGRVLYVKGAPEVLLELSSWQRAPGGGREPLEPAYWLARVEEIASRGERALAIATRELDREPASLSPEDVGDLTLLAVAGIADPPRPEAIAAVGHCLRAGIDVKMVTGDHALTAQAIGAQLGLRGHSSMTGAELDTHDDAQLAGRALETDVFARMNPAHKLRLVRALQARGKVTAMTGDGVNDAPALKQADVGIAMGRGGTEVSKEAAELVLADDNFATIAAAVEEGRTVYDNVKKAITFILPTNLGEALTIVAAVAVGTTLPITAVQILWVNMITAVTLALAIAFEPAEQGIMLRPPRRPDEPILSGFLLWRVGFVSALLLVGVFGLYLLERRLGASVAVARTVAVNVLVACEAAYLLNSRFIEASALNRSGLLGSRLAWGAIGLVAALQVLFTYAPPFQKLFDTRALGAGSWARVFAVAVGLLLAVEVEKAILRRLHGRPPRGTAQAGRAESPWTLGPRPSRAH
jgi:magnesium-transporting ATPase (P-type)